MLDESYSKLIFKAICYLKLGAAIYNMYGNNSDAEKCVEAISILQSIEMNSQNVLVNAFAIAQKAKLAMDLVRDLLVNILHLCKQLHIMKNPQLIHKYRDLSSKTFKRVYQKALTCSEDQLKSWLTYNEDLDLRYTNILNGKTPNKSLNSKRFNEFCRFLNYPVKKMKYPEECVETGSSMNLTQEDTQIIFLMMDEVFDDKQTESLSQSDSGDLLSRDIFYRKDEKNRDQFRREMISELVFRRIKSKEFNMMPFRVGTRPLNRGFPFLLDQAIRKITRWQHAGIQIGPYIFDYGVDSVVQQSDDNLFNQDTVERSRSIQQIFKTQIKDGKSLTRSMSKTIFKPFIKAKNLLRNSSSNNNDNAYNIDLVTKGVDQYSDWTSSKDMIHSGWSFLDAADLKLLINNISDWKDRGKYDLIKHNCQGFVIFCLGLIYEANCIAYDHVSDEIKRKLFFVFDYTSNTCTLKGRTITYDTEYKEK